MSMNIVKLAKTVTVFALVVSGGAHAGTSSQSLTKQLSAVSPTGVVAQPAIVLPPLKSQQQLKAFYASLPPASRKVLVASYKALPPSVQARYVKIYKDLPVSPA